MYILGISSYFHDSSAALLKDGIIIAAAEEERFTRLKHDTSFPVNAIKFCLEYANIDINKIDHIAFYEKPIKKFERIICQHLHSFPKSFWTFYKSMPSWINEKLRAVKIIKKKLKYKGNIFFIDHHMCHAASAYLPSPFKEAVIVTIDGVGEWATTTAGYAKENEMTIKKQIYFPHSIGLLYSATTAFLGFSVNNSEYKVMGLSAYGNKDKKTNLYYQKFKNVINMKEDGSYQLDMSYFVYIHKMAMPGKKFIEEFGPLRKKEDPLTQDHKDIAMALQLITEEAIFNLLNAVQKETQAKYLCIAGGVALNSVANGKILSETKFKEVWIQPAAGDGGTSLGAALYAYNIILGKERTWEQKDAYLGPGYANDYIKQFLEKNNIKYTKFKSREEKIQTTAKLIKEDNVIGWFQGRMEWGPRALGARSILSNATNPRMQEILNLKVKHREKFRPFAPVVCEDDAHKYFECDTPIPKPTDFMLMVYPIKEKFHKKIPSVTHIDGSGRLQTIRREQNQDYYDLIKEFGKQTGIPILINTSFNIRGEPIVLSPYYAYRCMMGTEIDCLVMEDFLIKRKGNMNDAWDSEKLAQD